MEALRWLLERGASRVIGTFAPASPYGAPALCGALLFALGWFLWRRRERGRPVNLKAFVRVMFPRRILLHPSSLVDVGLWTLNTIVFASGYALLALGSFFWRDHTVGALTGLFGAHGAPGVPPGLALLVSTHRRAAGL